MPLTHIPQHELDRERRQAERFAASQPAKTEMRGGDGVMLRRIPIKAYLNATAVHGYSPKDEEYWKDQERLFPEIKCKYVPRTLRVTVGNAQQQIATGQGQPESKLTRFGRVTFHKNYGK
jgi:hypothetical protein